MAEPSEVEWQAQVVQLAGMLGWRHNHTRRSIGKGRKWTTATSVVGWPDLELWHEQQQRVIYAELKTRTGRLTPEQKATLISLARAGCEVAVWRPADLPDVHEALQGKRLPSLPVDG